MAKLMGIDLGQKRIGIAVSDPDETIAFPERVLNRRGTISDCEALARLVRELRIERVVVGLPLAMSGTAGPNADRAKRFGESLGRAVDVPIEFQDERMTTIEAADRLSAAGVPWQKQKQRIDAAAAAVILEDYMRARRS
ncbi:MAG: Holliday junction resolvase RuvX [Chloroflexi bacterium]|nr:Holliday junction resolvase RuvX [Chloroflexota bacterium]